MYAGTHSLITFLTCVCVCVCALVCGCDEVLGHILKNACKPDVQIDLKGKHAPIFLGVCLCDSQIRVEFFDGKGISSGSIEKSSRFSKGGESIPQVFWALRHFFA